jgi:hypothetical protein
MLFYVVVGLKGDVSLLPLSSRSCQVCLIVVRNDIIPHNSLQMLHETQVGIHSNDKLGQ